MEYICSGSGSEEGSPQHRTQSNIRRSARLIAKNQQIDLQKSHLPTSNHLIKSTAFVDTNSKGIRSRANSSEKSLSTVNHQSIVDNRKVSSSLVTTIKEPPKVFIGVDTTPYRDKQKRNRSQAFSADLDSEDTPVVKKFDEREEKKRLKKTPKTDTEQSSSSEVEVTDIKLKRKKRKRLAQQQQEEESNKNKKKISKDSKQKYTIKKGKHNKKLSSLDNSAIRKSVIQYAMSSSNDNNQPGPSKEGSNPQETEASSIGDSSDPIDPFVALMNEESKRLQMLLESHRLPPHLLGSLGTRIPHFFHKHTISSNSSKGQQLLEGIQCIEDESVQLQSCIEMGQLLVMGNEDTLSGFPVKEAVPSLLQLLSMEHNFDMMMNACRALTYMMEALPRSTIVVAEGIPVLLEKLQVIQCMDVAEQALSALEILSRKHSKSILLAGGVNSCLLYLDFFSLNTQRCALSVAANCCLSVTEAEYNLIIDSIPILSNRLHHQDKKSVESCCLSFSRLVDNLHNNPQLLQAIASHGLLSSVQSLLMISPPILTPHMFVVVIRMLLIMCSSSPLLAVELLKLNIGETLKYLLVGSEEITLETIEINSRSSNEFYEIVSLISELMPPLPTDGIFEVDKLMTTNKRLHHSTQVQWEWQDDKNTWRPYGQVESRIIEHARMAGEEDAAVDIGGRNYIIEFAIMQQINEETGNSRPVRRTHVNTTPPELSDTNNKKQIDDDPRTLALCAEPNLCYSIFHSLFGVLYEVFTNMTAPSIKYKCLKALLRMINCATSELLTEVLSNISVSSYIATMLKSQDYKVVVGAFQMAVLLMDKLPDIFAVYFHREGVMHAMENLKSLQLKSMITPKKPDQPTQPDPPPDPPLPLLSISMPRPSLSTPEASGLSDSPSTARRFVDMFRKSRRHLRKSLSRTRSEDVPSDASPVLVPNRVVPLVPILPPPSMTTPAPLSSILIQKAQTSKGSSPEEASTTKEKIREWIVQQVTLFLDKWTTNVDENPAVEAMKTLETISEQLDPSHPSCLDAISMLYEILCNSETNMSAFEFMHCNIPEKLVNVLSFDDNQIAIPLNGRLRHFLHLFMDLPEQDDKLSSWTLNERPGLVVLLQKLHASVSQTEQLPVKVNDMPGKRGSHAMKFFNTHQIKCNLGCHSTATGVQPWKGGVVRVDPLATLQAVERYLLVKGVTKPDPIPITNEDMEGSDDSDSEEPLLPTIPTGPVKQQLEFLINDNVISHNMTVFQAVKQYGLASPSSDSEEELSPLGHPDIWIKSHMLHYRLVGQGQPSGLKPKRSYSLPATPFESTQPKRLPTSGNGGGTKSRRTKLSSLSKEGIRVTRSMSREQQHHHGDTQDNPINFDTYTTPTTGLSPLLQDIKYYRDNPINVKDASAPIINLLRILWSLNNHWNDLYNGFPGNPIVAPSEFISNKLTAKATRQLQDPLNVMTGNFPDWLKGLSSQCPFLFPFECRQTLFFLITFDRDRGIARLQEQQPELSLLDASERITPKLEKKKRCVSRDNLLSQAEKIMEELSSSRALLEIQYEDEVGIGLGPTLEFYTLVSRELQKIDLHMWRGDPCPLPGSSSSYVSDSSGLNQYIYSSVGLYPAPIGASTDFSVVEEICARFRFLGRFMAKAIMDFRMLDLPLSEAFNKWILGQENSFTAQDLQHVDPIISQSFAQLADIAVKKRQLENDSLLTGTALQLGIQSLTLDGGGTIEGLELDFTLPGYPDIELKPNGRNVPVTIHNLDEYLKLMLDWTLITGVRRQMQAFQEGFNDVFSISTLQCFYSYEMDMFLCGANNQKWDIKELMEHCRPDHGYNHDSQAIQYLFQVLSSYSTAEQRQFIQFVTGSPRLPVGGFKALNPPLTIVRKTTDSSLSPDNFLPSVMTCVNYLKLPDYTSESVMREKLNIALKEGKQSFHLS